MRVGQDVTPGLFVGGCIHVNPTNPDECFMAALHVCIATFAMKLMEIEGLYYFIRNLGQLQAALAITSTAACYIQCLWLEIQLKGDLLRTLKMQCFCRGKVMFGICC